jgi:hypothetical protein
MNFISRASVDVIQDYIISGKYIGGDGQTAEECWESLEIMGMERPDKDEFINKVNERNTYYQMKELRRKRDELLNECDYIMISDYPNPHKELWIKYRQELRDLPTTADLSNTEYPSKPM